MRHVLVVLVFGCPTPTGDTDSGGACRTDCCKVCDDSKACGDSCISEADECSAGAGCACEETEACE